MFIELLDNPSLGQSLNIVILQRANTHENYTKAQQPFFIYTNNILSLVSNIQYFICKHTEEVCFCTQRVSYSCFVRLVNQFEN